MRHVTIHCHYTDIGSVLFLLLQTVVRQNIYHIKQGARERNLQEIKTRDKLPQKLVRKETHNVLNLFILLMELNFNFWGLGRDGGSFF